MRSIVCCSTDEERIPAGVDEYLASIGLADYMMGDRIRSLLCFCPQLQHHAHTQQPGQ